jgi:AcrR family transcriptional regulator
MPSDTVQMDLLEAARSLLLRDPDRFSVAALCRETGLSRAKMRQHFPNKAALMTALLKEEPEAPVPLALPEEKSGEPDPAREIVGEGWIERRFRVFERALSLLENKTEGATAEHSRALTMIEERLYGQVKTPVAELPPIMAAANPLQEIAVPDSENASSPPAVKDTPVVMPPLEFQAAASGFDARKKMRSVLEKMPAAIGHTPEKQPSLKQMSPWLMAGAGLTGLGLLFGGLLVVSAVRNAPSTPPAQIAAAPKPAAPQKTTTTDYETANHVVVIDATGAKPAPAVLEIDMRAERGDAHAKVETALAYLRGQDVEPDAGAAMRWVQAAAAQGDATGQLILGSLYAKGMAPDPRRAAKWYAAAAAQGNAKAMHNLALAYLAGDGVEKNSATAIEWFTKAANEGYIDSAMNLAVLYDRGEDVDRDPREALYWYDAAATKGDGEAEIRAKALRRQLARLAGR